MEDGQLAVAPSGEGLGEAKLAKAEETKRVWVTRIVKMWKDEMWNSDFSFRVDGILGRLVMLTGSWQDRPAALLPAVWQQSHVSGPVNEMSLVICESNMRSMEVSW